MTFTGLAEDLPRWVNPSSIVEAVETLQRSKRELTSEDIMDHLSTIHWRELQPGVRRVLEAMLHVLVQKSQLKQTPSPSVPGVVHYSRDPATPMRVNIRADFEWGYFVGLVVGADAARPRT